MGQLFDRISRVVQAKLNSHVDSEKLLDITIEQMEENAKDARQAIVNLTMASTEQLQQQYRQAQKEVRQWEWRAQFALQKGDEHLAQEALNHKKMHIEVRNNLKAQLNQEPASVTSLKQNLMRLEANIAKAKAVRVRLKAATTKAGGQLPSTTSLTGTSIAMAAFERMEDQALQMEARSQAAAELVEVDLEQTFAALEAGSDVDDELAKLKEQMIRSSQNSQTQLSSPESTKIAPRDAAVDAELEELKRQLDAL